MRPSTPERTIEKGIPTTVDLVTPQSSVGSTSGNVENPSEVNNEMFTRYRKLFQLHLTTWKIEPGETIPEHIERFKKEILGLMPPGEDIHEVLKTFRKGLPLTLRAFTTIPREPVNLEEFFEDVLFRFKRPNEKHLTAREYKQKFLKK